MVAPRFALLAAILIAEAYAPANAQPQQAGPDPKLVLEQYRAALGPLQAKGSRASVHGMQHAQVVANGKSKSPLDYEMDYITSGDNYRVVTISSRPKYGQRVVVHGPKSFMVRRDQESGPYFLESASVLKSTDIALSGRRTAILGAAWTVAALDEFPRIVAAPQFEFRRVEFIRAGDRELLAVDFHFPGSEDHRFKLSGNLHLDPARGLAIIRSDTQITAAKAPATTKRATTVEYFSDADEVLPRSVTSTIETKVGNQSTHEEFRFEATSISHQVDPAVFTLAAYGLGDFERPPALRRASPVSLWVAGAAALLIVAGFALRTYARRSARGPANA